MPDVAQIHAESVRDVQRYMGRNAQGRAVGPAVIWAGTSYECSASGDIVTKDLVDGGFVEVRRRSVTILERLFKTADRPQAQKTVQFLQSPNATAQPYRIESSDPLAGGTLRRLSLVSIGKGA